MREIKFRGKRKEDGCWVYGGFILDADSKPRVTTLDEFGEGLVFHQVVPETVGEFTGLKDKNGKEIYEGDIVKDGEDLFHVCFGEYDKTNVTHIGFYLISLSANDFVIGTLWEGCEVIGNIYEKKSEVAK